jgi:hypothetical protein
MKYFMNRAFRELAAIPNAFTLRVPLVGLLAVGLSTTLPPILGAVLLSANADEPLATLRVLSTSDGQDVWEADVVDASESLRKTRAKAGDPTLLELLRRTGPGYVIVEVDPTASESGVRRTMQLLKQARIENVHLLGPFVFHEGRLYHTSLAMPPSLDLNVTRLQEMLAVLLKRDPSSDLIERERGLSYEVLVNEDRTIARVRELNGISVPGMEREISHTRILLPGRRGGEFVPGVALVRIPLN